MGEGDEHTGLSYMALPSGTLQKITNVEPLRNGNGKRTE